MFTDLHDKTYACDDEVHRPGRNPLNFAIVINIHSQFEGIPLVSYNGLERAFVVDC